MKEIMLNGDYLGTTEEFLPGKGTYTEEGKIYASIIGNKILDSKSHVASVDGKSREELTIGDVVFGEVLNVQSSIVQVIVKKITPKKTARFKAIRLILLNSDMFFFGEKRKVETA